MIEITPFQSQHISEAKRVISLVAFGIFGRDRTLEQFMAMLENEQELDDLDNYQSVYMENRGLLLVALDNGKLVGTGGVRKKDDETAELKRIWLLEEYHGQQIGFRVVKQLLEFAREQGYRTVYLETTRRNKRALGFYGKLGFYEIPSPYEDEDDVAMELKL